MDLCLCQDGIAMRGKKSIDLRRVQPLYFPFTANLLLVVSSMYRLCTSSS